MTSNNTMAIDRKLRTIGYCYLGNHVVKCKILRTGSSYSGGTYYTCPYHSGVKLAGILDVKIDVPKNAKWESETIQFKES